MVSYQVLGNNNLTGGTNSRRLLGISEDLQTPPNEFANDPSLGLFGPLD